MNQWFDPVPDLFDRIILRRICRKCEEIQIRTFLEEPFQLPAAMNRGAIQNNRQTFSLELCPKLMQESKKDAGVTFRCAFPVKTFVDRIECAKYRKTFPSLRSPEGKNLLLVCASLESHKVPLKNEIHQGTARWFPCHLSMQEFLARFVGPVATFPLSMEHWPV